MLHALAMLIGLSVVWLLLVPAWGAQDMIVAGVAALACVIGAARLGGFGRGGAFSHAFAFSVLTLGRAGAVLRGAAAVWRASVFGGASVRPALVRMRLRPSSEFARAMLADMASAAPGGVTVDVDDDSLLVHVLNEDGAEAAQLGQLETRIVRAIDGKGRAA